MNCNPIPVREDWYITDKNPTICPRCKKKEVWPSKFGMPTQEVSKNGKCKLQACKPVFQSIELGAVLIVILLFIKITQ